MLFAVAKCWFKKLFLFRYTYKLGTGQPSSEDVRTPRLYKLKAKIYSESCIVLINGKYMLQPKLSVLFPVVAAMDQIGNQLLAPTAPDL